MRKKSLIFATVFVIFDQIIKLFIDNIIPMGGKINIIPHFFRITKIYNLGAAWSIFNGGRYMLIAIAIASFGILYSYEKCFRYKERTMFGFALIYGGLIGNLLDRLILGHVIDYLEFYVDLYHFPVFNLADMCLVIGFLLVIIALFKGEDKYAIDKRKRRDTD